MKNFVYVLLFSFLLFGCNQGSSDVEREYIKNLEEKNRVLEKELHDKNESESDSKKEPEKKRTKKTSKDYFTIGSTEDEVLDVMGDPTSLTSIGSFGKIYNYGYSSITFKGGRVESYDNEGNLKVKVRD
jgi:hypothetical protein